MYPPQLDQLGGWTNHMWNSSFWGMGWMMLFGLIILAAIGAAVYYSLFPRRRTHVRSEDALELARTRYARGETTAEEFEEIRKRLE